MADGVARQVLTSLFIEPARMLAGLWDRRELVWQFTHRNIELRHRGSRLGAFWALINPLSMLALYYFVFGRVYGTRFDHIVGETDFDFALALFLGLCLFHVFTETLSAAPGVIVTNPNFVKKVVFPLEVLPMAQLGAAVFHLSVGLGLVLVGSAFGTSGLSWHAALLPILIVPLILLSAGVSFFLAALGVFLRDVGQVTAFIATALLFGSAVMYPPSRIPESFAFLRFNPLLQIVDLARETALSHHLPALDRVAFVYVVGFGCFACGLIFFSLLRRSFAEVI